MRAIGNNKFLLFESNKAADISLLPSISIMINILFDLA